MQRQRALFTFGGLAALLAGCASTEPLEARHLPFRIGVVPLEEPAVGEISPGELPGEETEIALELDTERLISGIRGALGEYCFSSVTSLKGPGPDEVVDSFERRRQLLEEARREGVDLVVELALRYDREVYRKNAPAFWMNIPLFLFASPSNWFLADNEYYADVELQAAVYDLNALEAGGLEIGDPTAHLISTTSRFTGTRLDFIDRSDDIGDYALTILIPSGWLARESDSVATELEEAIIEQLRAQVVQGIQSRRSELVRADWIAPVFVEPGRVRLQRQGDELLVRGDVMLKQDGLAGRVQALHFDAGNERISVEPASATRTNDQGYDVLPFEARVPVGEGSRTLRLECEAGARDRYVRSYTFAIPGS